VPAITRRQLLVGAGGVALAGAAGAYSLTNRTSGHGTFRNGTFVSAARKGVRVGWSVNEPAGHDAGPLRPLIVLHGRGGNHNSAFSGGLHLDSYLHDVVSSGAAPFAIASVDGGDHEYWHPRLDGDPAAMVIHEFIPLLTRLGLDTSKVGFLGWSMGGYGALYLSGVLSSSTVAVAVAESPAIWQHSYQSAAGAFDSAQDFDEHAIFGHQSLLAGIALRIDCGASDGFAPITRELRASLHPTPAGGIEPGAHDDAYWRSQAAAQLRFVAGHLPA
jgi:hypothetical protein